VFQLNDLLIASGVNGNEAKVEFKPIDIKADVRVNSLTGNIGFTPVVKESVIGLNAKGGGAAQQVQVRGVVVDKSVGHLDLDHHSSHDYNGGVVEHCSIWGGDSC